MSDTRIVRQLVVELPVEDCFGLVGTLEGLQRWLPVTRFQPHVGAPFALEEQGRTATGAVLEIDPPRRVMVSWDWLDAPFPEPTTVHFELEPLGSDRTALRIVHAGFPSEDIRDGHARVWDTKVIAVPEQTRWDVEETVVLSASPAAVFAVIADPRRDPEWCSRVDDVTQVHGDGPSAGSRYRSTHRPIPMPAQAQDVELLALAPPDAALIAVRNQAGALLVLYTLEPSGTGTRLTEHDAFDLARFARPALPAFRAVKRRRVRQQFAGLERLLREGPVVRP